MTISSHEYQSSTDDDIFLWHHTENAKNLLEFISSGHDAGDEKLPSDALEGKYQGKVLEEKSRNFAKLKIEEQKDILLSGITGDVTGKAKQIKDAPAHVLIITKVRFFLGKLQEIGKFDEWINTIETDPAVPDTYKLIPRLCKSGFYDENPKYID